MIDSKELNRLNKKLNKMGKELAQAAVEVPDEITRELAIGANDIRTTILKSMQSTDRAPWFYWRGKKPGRKKHYPSAPGAAPAIDSGDLLKSIMFDVRDMEVEVGSIITDPPYPTYLEDGTKKMKARPWLGPAVDKHEKTIIDKVGDGVFETIKRGVES